LADDFSCDAKTAYTTSRAPVTGSATRKLCVNRNAETRPDSSPLTLPRFGDGSYLMMAQEIVTSMQEKIKLNIVLFDKHGFSSIGGYIEGQQVAIEILSTYP
jgi:hypothetical protein